MNLCRPLFELSPEGNGGPLVGLKNGRSVVSLVSLKGPFGCHVEHAFGSDKTGVREPITGKGGEREGPEQSHDGRVRKKYCGDKKSPSGIWEFIEPGDDGKGVKDD